MGKLSYGACLRASRNEMRKTNTHPELHLIKDVKDSKKGFFKYINNNEGRLSLGQEGLG